MSTFFAGPWVGEFGWEIMTWVPAVRQKAKKYDHTIIACQPDRRYLYEDFCDDFLQYFPIAGVPERWNRTGIDPRETFPFVSCDKRWTPSETICCAKKRSYVEYGEKDENPGYHYDLVIHARNCSKKHKGADNWPLKNYSKLLKQIGDVKACSIGSPMEASWVEGTTDLRGISLASLSNIMRNSSVLASPSSGPAHLSNLCGLPLVVWTYDKWLKSIRATNRKRYEKLWRPFPTPVTVIDKYGWQPPVEAVVKALKEYL